MSTKPIDTLAHSETASMAAEVLHEILALAVAARHFDCAHPSDDATAGTLIGLIVERADTWSANFRDIATELETQMAAERERQP